MFRVEWLQEALDELTRIWLDADPSARKAITAATHTLDQELRFDPYRQSESRENDERVIFVYPLAAHIEIDLHQRIVWVLHVWRYRRRQ
jgi:hypothetical protein